MFDLKRHSSFIAASFFKHFKSFNRPDSTQKFIERWLHLLSTYSRLPDFSCFDTPIPLIENLPSKPLAVLVISNRDRKPDFSLSHTTQFPVSPFRVYLTNGKVVHCKEGVELLCLYLEITRIRWVGFYRGVYDYKGVAECLRSSSSSSSSSTGDLKIYPPSLFKYFCRMTKGHYGTISKKYDKNYYLREIAKDRFEIFLPVPHDPVNHALLVAVFESITMRTAPSFDFSLQTTSVQEDHLKRILQFEEKDIIQDWFSKNEDSKRRVLKADVKLPEDLILATNVFPEYKYVSEDDFKLVLEKRREVEEKKKFQATGSGELLMMDSETSVPTISQVSTAYVEEEDDHVEEVESKAV